jgi:hypothetical protein
VDVTVPQGALSERRTAGLVEEATRTVLEAAGLSRAEALRVWVRACFPPLRGSPSRGRTESARHSSKMPTECCRARLRGITPLRELG